MVKIILLVEDDEDIVMLLWFNFQDEGYQIVYEVDGGQVFVWLEMQVWDVVIFDLMLFGVDGLEICWCICQMICYLLVIIISVCISEMYCVLGLEMGVDDYLVKFFLLLEFIVCVKVLFCCQEVMGQNLLMDVGCLFCYGLSIDLLLCEVKLCGEMVDFMLCEFDLLYYFVCYFGEVFFCLVLLEQVWGYQYEGYEYIVNIYINCLCSKIECDLVELDIIFIVWGKGYKFVLVM